MSSRKKDALPSVVAKVIKARSARRGSRKGSKYDVLVDQITGMQNDQMACLNVPKGTTQHEYRKTVRSALSYRFKGTDISVRVEKLDDGRIGITKTGS